MLKLALNLCDVPQITAYFQRNIIVRVSGKTAASSELFARISQVYTEGQAFVDPLVGISWNCKHSICEKS
jgi:hypothetical protein